MRVSAVSDRARYAGGSDDEHDDHEEHRVRRVPKWRPEVPAAAIRRREARARRARGLATPLVVAGEQHLLLGLHGLRLVGVLVVHTEKVQQPVHDQQRQLVVEGAGVVGCVA